MNTQSDNPKPRRKWETPAVSVLAFRDTRVGKDITASDTHVPAPMTSILSDVCLKRDVVPVGHLDNGIGLYGYRYLWDDQAYVGVLAQEVAKIVPEAVVYGEDGYLRVNYERLGLRLVTWDEWVARNHLPLEKPGSGGRQRHLN